MSPFPTLDVPRGVPSEPPCPGYPQDVTPLSPYLGQGGQGWSRGLLLWGVEGVGLGGFYGHLGESCGYWKGWDGGVQKGWGRSYGVLGVSLGD